MKKILMLLFFALSIINCLGQTAEEFFECGTSMEYLYDYKGAIEYYTKAIEINPKYADAYVSRGLAKIGLRQKDSGCLDLSRAGELGSDIAYDAIKEFCN